jgi:membrane associated rhomboid family serine protease
MLPLSDGIPARRFPIVNVLPIVANFAVWIFYELPQLNTAVYHASFYPCTVNSASANGGGVAFFAHVGGFIFGLLVARLLARAGQAASGEQRRSTA